MLGTDFSEGSTGTSAFALCRQTGRTVFVTGSQHYLYLFRNRWSIAKGIVLPDGNLLWVFGLVAPLEREPHMAVAIVNLFTDKLKLETDRIWHKGGRLVKSQDMITTFGAELLTRREREILPYLIGGKTYKQIGDILFISLGTVNTHVCNIYNKFQVSGRRELRYKLEVSCKDNNVD